MKPSLGNKIFIILFNIILFFTGMYFFNNPLVFSYYICLYIGILLIAGAISNFSYFLFKKEKRHLSVLLEGILLLLTGFFLLTNIDSSTLFFGTILGSWLVLDGLVKIGSGFSFKKNGFFGGIILIIFGVLSILFGVYVLSNLLISSIITASTLGLIVSFNALISIFKIILFKQSEEKTK